jgi:glycosyltransferase involved in cell wall biosynthesis
MLELSRQRWGGDLRRAQIFRRLAVRTGARVADGWSIKSLARTMGVGSFILRALPLPLSRPRLASSEQLRPDMLRLMRRAADPSVVAIYDDPVAQTASLGMTMSPARRALYTARRDDNLAAFRWHAVPTRSFAEMIGMDPATTIVAGNATNVAHIRPGKWPEQPAVGMVSGAAPGRGIESLIAAARALHPGIPTLRLLLWLVPTGPESEAYLDGLRAATAGERWIRIETVGYERISESLAQATVLTIPHPPGDYMDVALPVKLFDSMAAGRPLVVTPRAETRVLVEQHGVGVVARGDAIDDLAAALEAVLGDEAAARRYGAAARRAAEAHFDWTVVGDRIADEVLAREGLLGAVEA